MTATGRSSPTYTVFALDADGPAATDGEAAGEAREAAARFVLEHKRGAKIAAAEAFGFARYGAAFLAVLAAAGDYFVRNEEVRAPSER